MKKMFLAIVLVVGMTAIAQQKEMNGPGKDKMTSEQKTALYVKKLKLDLDLNDKQEAEIKKLAEARIKNHDAQREEFKANREKAEADRTAQRVAMKSKMLDEQIAIKAEMKKILTPEQYTKWEKIQSEKHHKGEHGKHCKK